jgi:hypothetical protein
MKERGERAQPGDTLARGSTVPPREAPTLSDLGITKTQSSRWQKEAKLTANRSEPRPNLVSQIWDTKFRHGGDHPPRRFSLDLVKTLIAGIGEQSNQGVKPKGRP